MSGTLRQRLGPARGRLKRLLEDEESQEQFEQLEGAVRQVEDLLAEWLGMLNRLEGDALEEEKDIYEQWNTGPSGVRGLLAEAQLRLQNLNLMRQPHHSSEQRKPLLTSVPGAPLIESEAHVQLLSPPQDQQSFPSRSRPAIESEAESNPSTVSSASSSKKAKVRNRQSRYDLSTVTSDDSSDEESTLRRNLFPVTPTTFNPKPLSPFSKKPSQVRTRTRRDKAEMYVPPMKPPILQPDRLQFHQWWSWFNRHVHSLAMSDEQKLEALRSVVDDTIARDVIGPISSEYYEYAISRLWDRFGDPTMAISDLYQSLKKIPPAREANEVQGTMDKVHAILIQLTELEEDVNSPHVLAECQKKIPPAILQQMLLEQRRKNGSRPVAPWNMSQLKQKWSLDEFREILATVLETYVEAECKGAPVEQTSETWPVVRPPDKTQATALRYRPQQQSPRRQQPEMRTVRQPEWPREQRPLPCLFCSSREHRTTNCNRFQGIARVHRLQFLRKCLICLSDDHREADCPNHYRTCRLCGKDPHPNYFYCPVCHHRISASGADEFGEFPEPE